MDIFRSDLNAGFKNKLFETEIEHVNDRNIVLENNTLVCELTSGKTKNGFKITGHLINNVVNDCDRCLCSYICLLYTSPSPRDAHESRMPSSA